jgi:AcrR family transcriptional regulator
MRGMNRGRPRNFDPDLVLENAMQLFWSQGYEATSLQDLLMATGLSKSSLYESFGNKQSLFEAAFTRYFDTRARHMLERLEQAESPLGFVRECLLSVLEDAQRGTPRGCMLVNVANEFSTADPAVQPLIELATRRFRQVFERAFAQAQARGELADRQSPADLALYMHCAMSGLRTQTKSAIARKDLLTVIELVMANLR